MTPELLPRPWWGRIFGQRPLWWVVRLGLVFGLSELPDRPSSGYALVAVSFTVSLLEGSAAWQLEDRGLVLRSGPIVWRTVAWRGVLAAEEGEIVMGRGSTPGVYLIIGVEGLTPLQRSYDANMSWPERLRPRVRRIIALFGSTFLGAELRVEWIRQINDAISRRN